MLSKLVNISGVIEARLNETGIFTPEQLYQTGSKKAFLQIKIKDPTACINMLYALEGAVQGLRWHSLPDSEKAQLKEFYKSL